MHGKEKEMGKEEEEEESQVAIKRNRMHAAAEPFHVRAL